MSQTDSLSARLRSELFSASSAVQVVSTLAAVIVAYVMQSRTGNSTVAVGALLGVGIGVSTLFREWDIHHLSTGAVVFWAVGVSALAAILYGVVFEIASGFVANLGLAGLVTAAITVGLGITFSLTQQWRTN
ncbi:hypothetical protein [Halococcus hamelinensis]|uniref:Uncharacterized protein n=1 Tax=Halococcus hamelinensis 100A6 TaxID=1132509 RepID=M0M084_9EURY|nr:hypothetical protein [Halococcus hamelinensis]EMA37795.1 hypothetical protein C447_12520 [Halococcus hamelinensis 100A6]